MAIELNASSACFSSFIVHVMDSNPASRASTIGHAAIEYITTLQAMLDVGALPCGAYHLALDAAADGVTVTDARMATVRLTRHEFHGDWNYTIHPASPRQRRR